MTNPRTSRSFFLWGAVAASVALVAAMAALLIAYVPNPAQAAGGSCSTTSGTTTCNFGPTGAEDTFEVPQGVSTIHVVATGAPGGVGNGGAPGGLGAQVSADLAASPGQTLYVNVGGTPTGGAGCDGSAACHGGFNGGGSSSSAGGGGGASDVRFVSRDQNNTLFSRLIVAAGGGGGGSGFSSCPVGGSGGSAGTDGGAGQTADDPGPSCTTHEGTQGSAGTQTAGGAGGNPGGGSLDLGQSGSLGQGGGGNVNGGGGGGGLFGGGSGVAPAPGRSTLASGGGGGGGGSNLFFGDGSATISKSGPSVTIRYQAVLGGEEPPPTEPEDKQACKKGGWKDFGFKNQGQCIKAVNHPR
jgi:glycine rich protein